MWEWQKTLIFPTRFNFSALLHWTREGSLSILPSVFCPKSETSHFCKSFQKIVFFKKFLWTSKSHFWQACRNQFCQTLYYVIAQSRELIRKVWFFHKTLVFSICSSGQKDVSSEKIAENISWNVLQDFCSKSENQNKKLIFKRKSPKMIFWTRRLRFSTLPEINQPNWKKRSFQNTVLLQKVPLDA